MTMMDDDDGWMMEDDDDDDDELSCTWCWFVDNDILTGTLSVL